MNEPTKPKEEKRSFDDIYANIHALDMLYAMLQISDKDYDIQHKTLMNELKGLSNDD